MDMFVKDQQLLDLTRLIKVFIHLKIFQPSQILKYIYNFLGTSDTLAVPKFILPNFGNF